MLGYPFCPVYSQNRGPGLLSFGPGLSKTVELTHIFSAGLTPEGTVQSCCVILGFITQSKYYTGPRGRLSCPISKFSSFLSHPFIPVGFALRKLPFSPTRLDTPLSQLSFGCVSSAICIFTKGSQWRGF